MLIGNFKDFVKRADEIDLIYLVVIIVTEIGLRLLCTCFSVNIRNRDVLVRDTGMVIITNYRSGSRWFVSITLVTVMGSYTIIYLDRVIIVISYNRVTFVLSFIRVPDFVILLG